MLRGARLLVVFIIWFSFTSAAAEVDENPLLTKTIVFSQGEANEPDEQVFNLGAGVNLRAWQSWHLKARKKTDFDGNLIQRYKNNKVLLIAGGTASVVFREEAESDAQFSDWVTVDAEGEKVPHNYIVPGAHRASLANPNFRRYLVDTMKLQIDAGVDGLFLDEVNAGAYNGGTKWGFNGNEGFDRYFLADFNRYLLKKYPNFTKQDWRRTFKMEVNNYPRHDFPADDLKNNFNYRQYLKHHGWQTSPMIKKNPLVNEWGTIVSNRIFPEQSNFREQAIIRYWKDIVDSLRQYAREQHQRDILITSNGVFPFVDFNSVGLYEYNRDDYDSRDTYSNGQQANYVPVIRNKLNGSVSLQTIFKNLYAFNKSVAGDVPLVLFIDWPTEMMRDYNQFSYQQREDYWRLYMADAYASGLRFAFHLKTSIPGDPSAESQNMLPFFKAHSNFYSRYVKECPKLSPGEVQYDINRSNIDVSVWESSDKHRYCIHLVNHNYRKKILAQKNINLLVKGLKPPTRIRLLSANEYSELQEIDIQAQAKPVEIVLSELEYSAIVLVDY